MSLPFSHSPYPGTQPLETPKASLVSRIPPRRISSRDGSIFVRTFSYLAPSSHPNSSKRIPAQTGNVVFIQVIPGACELLVSIGEQGDVKLWEFRKTCLVHLKATIHLESSGSSNRLPVIKPTLHPMLRCSFSKTACPVSQRKGPNHRCFETPV